ncbi:MAG: penicillin acylase family protein [Desulfobacterales bacterium]
MRNIIWLFCIFLLLMVPAAEAKRPPSVAGLRAAVLVLRDIEGIPHIIANNEHDMVMMQGWVHARDRLFQMDFSRRQASGTLAEMLGVSALESDVEFRTIGLRRAAERSLVVLPEETKAALEAYASGVNAYVAVHPLPPEYAPLELTSFQPWTAVDSLVIGKLIEFGSSFDLDVELTEILLTYQGVGAKLNFDGTALFFEDLFRSQPFDPASTVPDANTAVSSDVASEETDERKGGASGHGEETIHPETRNLIKNYLRRVRRLPFFRRALEWSKRYRGSNEFAVSGRHTASGQPILANDPHLDLNMPATFYQIHLKAWRAGFDVIGSSFAGVPFVALGQNKHIAWGATLNPLDLTDVFQEEVVPDASSASGFSTIYLSNLEPIIPLPQVFRYNQIGDGVPDNLATATPGTTVGETVIPLAVLIVPRRNQGPIIELDPLTGTALSVQSTGFSGTREVDAIRSFNLARNLEDFTRALRHFDFGSRGFAYADRHGNIAYFTSGEMPLREDLQSSVVNGLPPFFIRNGTGGNEWLPLTTPQPGQAVPFEILPFEEMPQLSNPPTGWFVNANNDPLGITLDNDALNQLRPGGGIYYLNPGYDLGIRAGRITSNLKEQIAAGSVTPEDLQAIQADTVMLDAQVFTPYILAAFANAFEDDADDTIVTIAALPGVAEAVGRLSHWDQSTPTGVDEGFDAGDIEGQQSSPTEEEIDASVAATIYAVWRGQMIKNTIDAVLDAIGLPGPGSREVMKALRNLLDNFEVSGGIGASGLNFFNVPGVTDAATRRDILILKSLADSLDLLAGNKFEDAFNNSIDQEDYRWGRLHRLILKHPLGGPFSIPPAGGAFPPPFSDLAGIPVDGGFEVVDASSHSARADSSDDFLFDAGPARRYVGQPHRAPRRIEAETSLPGGESGVLGSPFYANLLEQWLINDTYKLRHRLKDILKGLEQSKIFVPSKKWGHQKKEHP